MGSERRHPTVTSRVRERLELARRLLEEPSERISTSSLGRLGRTGRAILRGRSIFGSDGEDPDPEAVLQLVRSLGELKGIAMKLGQILSYIDPSMPESTRQLLGALRTSASTSPFEEVERTLRADLRPEDADLLLAGMEATPVASASIGQVHRAHVEGAQLAVKVRHPGIDEAIAADFRAASIAPMVAAVLAPGADIEEVVSEARRTFLEECDYTLEARRQARFRELFREDDRILIPEVHTRFSGPRVLSSGWQEGADFDTFFERGPPPEVRNRIGAALWDFYFGSLYRHGLFNADPHPGNLLFGDDGRVLILDHGCVRELDRDTVRAFARLGQATRDDQRLGIEAALTALGGRPVKSDRGYELTRRLLRSFFAPLLVPGARAIEAGVALKPREIMRDKRAMMDLRLPGRLLFLMRIRFGLYAVLARTDACLDWQAMESALAEEALSLGAQAQGPAASSS